MSVTKKVVKKIRARNPLSEDDSDVSYDKGDYESDDDKKREPEEERVPADTLGSLGLPSFPECIVSREDWGAAKKKRKGLALKHPVANVTITYKTDVPKCTSDEECVKVIQELQKKHISEGMSDIAFK
ncbi:uncharacterized protein LOC128984957 [Macrosteles quadrilineatus]|uniref:uncharacterized protein LOC128984957 n=1 Tax=Macrosteles quadrilineatus TaxID=74068 RepID=UPI0023E0B6AC|nr:uncharacterized protein LOC128984957 [Macrosteles quadrilineatus]